MSLVEKLKKELEDSEFGLSAKELEKELGVDAKKIGCFLSNKEDVVKVSRKKWKKRG